MKPVKIFLNWIIFLGSIALIYFAWPYAAAFIRSAWHPQAMGTAEVLFFGLVLSFGWVEVLKWGTTKPFNCIKCMAGWFSLMLAILFSAPHAYIFLPAGVFIGAMFEAIKMRYL